MRSTPVGPENIAHACARAGARPHPHLHRLCVFRCSAPPVRDRRRDRPAERVRTHQAGGRADGARRACPTPTSSRSAWVYEGGDGGDFAGRDAPAGGAATDRWTWWPTRSGSPTYVGDLVDALLQIADDGSIREPVLHAANEGAVSRFEQAQSGVRGRRRRSRPGSARRQRPSSSPCAAAGVFGACPHGDPPRRA